MEENRFDIILQAINNASAEINKVKSELGGIEKSTDEVRKTTEKAGKTIKDQFKEASSSLRDFRKTTLIATVAIAAMIASVREAAKYNQQAADTYQEFTRSVQSFSAMIGVTLEPAMQGVTKVVQVLRDTIEAAIAGFIKLSTFIIEFFANILSGPVEAFKRAMEVSTLATDEFLEKAEETIHRVESGDTLDKIKQKTIDLGKISVTHAKLMTDAWNSVGSALGQLQSALAGAAEMGRGFAIAAQAVAIGMAIINTAEGVTGALRNREGFPWPFPLVIAGIIAAAGAIQIATITATKFAMGGRPSLGVPSLVGEQGPELFVPDTYGTIIPNNRLGGGSRQLTVQNYIYYPTIRSEEDIDTLTEEISNRLAREVHRI